jgi:hypothetical protein
MPSGSRNIFYYPFEKREKIWIFLFIIGEIISETIFLDFISKNYFQEFIINIISPLFPLGFYPG